MRLELNLLRAIYVTVAALFATGAGWWMLDEGPSTARLYLIAAHGLAAMLFLMGLGAVLVLHVPEGWRRRLNRTSGTIVLAMMSALIATAFGLYYFGSDTLRSLASSLHMVVGLILLPLLAVHVVLGRRGRRAAELSDAGAEPPGD